VRETEDLLNKKTLKDIDFDKYEKKIFISSEEALRCQNALERDARFFQNHKLMDYSLLVVKVNWAQFCIDHGVTIQAIELLFTHDLHIIESTREPGSYYHLAIIDYLQ
jgi:1-phosphatidylinositol-4-phosphate 5-kinase